MTGITVILHERVQTGVDAFGAPTYEPVDVSVENVLVGEPSGDEVVNDLTLYGKRLAYTLAIPKGDTHDWTDVNVTFFGETFRTDAGHRTSYPAEVE